jgi:hypothetical protein
VEDTFGTASTFRSGAWTLRADPDGTVVTI